MAESVANEFGGGSVLVDFGRYYTSMRDTWTCMQACMCACVCVYVCGASLCMRGEACEVSSRVLDGSGMYVGVVTAW